MHAEMTRPRIDARGAHANFALRLGMLALAMLLLPALALAQTGGAPKGNPRLASLNIEIWPAYDRPAALVILKAVLAQGVMLPATVTLRLPAASGGPSAVAFSSTADGNLLNLKHERQSAGEFVTLKFDVPGRLFQIEFYEPIATNLPAHSYRYTWPGDLAAERVTLVVQEPALASAISVEPKLDLTSDGPAGLRYRTAELGALEAGKPLRIVVRYTKTDTRTSAEIVKRKAGDSALPVAAPVTSVPASGDAPIPAWVLALLAVAFFVIGGLLIFLSWRRRAVRPATLAHGACTQCGVPYAPGNEFCGKCGAKLA